MTTRPRSASVSPACAWARSTSSPPVRRRRSQAFALSNAVTQAATRATARSNSAKKRVLGRHPIAKSTCGFVERRQGRFDSTKVSKRKPAQSGQTGLAICILALEKMRSHGEVDSDLRSGRVRLRTPTLETTMPAVADRPDAPTAIQTNLAAIFISLELSRSIWLITSLSPGSAEKMSKHSVRAGDVAALLARFSELKRKASERTGKSFPIVVIQEAGLDGFWLHRVVDQAMADRIVGDVVRHLQGDVGNSPLYRGFVLVRRLPRAV